MCSSHEQPDPVATSTDKAQGPALDASKMPEIRQLGICSTCDHRATCLFLKASRKPVWYCDEFTDSANNPAGTSPEPREPSQVSALTFNEAQEIGLCVNCESRKDCMHRKPGETVRECEDYK